MMIDLTASDGHKLAAYRADPKGTPRGGIVVIQEIFGVNAHMRKVTDSFAADGYLAICPALFDRASRGVELGYQPDDIQRGLDLRGKLGWPQVLADTAAAIAATRPAGRVGVVGYCWGGTVAWRAATQLDCDAAVCYYGGGIADFAAEAPKCPVLMHFGEKDQSIPASHVDTVRKAHPEIPIHLYPADHGFSCDARGSYDASSAKLARERTIEFFRRHIG